MQRRPCLVSCAGLLAALLSACGPAGNDAYVEYRPQANGDKPEAFQYGFWRYCRFRSAAERDTYVASVNAYAAYRRMSPTRPSKRDHVLASYGQGAPLREHLVLRRMKAHDVLIGISTLTGRRSCTECDAAGAHGLGCEAWRTPVVTIHAPGPVRVE